MLTIQAVITHNNQSPALAHRYVRTVTMPVGHAICLDGGTIANYRIDNHIQTVRPSYADCDCTTQSCNRCHSSDYQVQQLADINLDTEVVTCTKYGV